MKKIPCPACGAEVVFQSAASVYQVCPYCRSMLVRQDLKLEEIGKMAVLQADPSALQLGTGGRYQKNSFQLVGRLIQSWSDGVWNEWFALFDDGQKGWLAEAQGAYMVSFPVAASLPSLESLAPGRVIDIGGAGYQVDDIKRVTCTYSEGELPFAAPVGRKATSVDLRGDARRFGSLDYSDAGPVCYLGHYFEFDELHLTNLRQVDGW